MTCDSIEKWFLASDSLFGRDCRYLYGFQHIYRHPKTDFPHKNDDLIVNRHYEEARSNLKLNTFEGRLEKTHIFDKLLPLAKYAVSEIFGNFVMQSWNVKYKKFGFV